MLLTSLLAPLRPSFNSACASRNKPLATDRAVHCLQASSEPEAAALAEASRRAALRGKDPQAADRAELELVAALLGCQFGRTMIDYDRGIIALEVRIIATVMHSWSLSMAAPIRQTLIAQ